MTYGLRFGILCLALACLVIGMPVRAEGLMAIETPAREAVLIEAATGQVLFAKDGETAMPTSSMSKVMTMYMVFDALKTGRLKMDDMVSVSEKAWKQEGSRMFLNPGSRVSVSDLVHGVIVQSGNDAAVALAEGLGGSESAFADQMNAKAAQLGMTHSHFVSASGLPDPNHYSTPHDLAILALHIIRDFPEYYPLFSIKDFTYNGIKQGNRNPLLYRAGLGVDGLKTGHAEEAGYGIMVSSVRDGRRLVLVVNGLPDMQARADESARLLDIGYSAFGLYPLVKDGQAMAEAKVWLGTADTVPLVAAKAAEISLPRAARAKLSVTLRYDQPVAAPIQKGQPLGAIEITAPGIETQTVPLVAGADVPEVGMFTRIVRRLNRLLFGA